LLLGVNARGRGALSKDTHVFLVANHLPDSSVCEVDIRIEVPQMSQINVGWFIDATLKSFDGLSSGEHAREARA
jgi:hypothetical protein